MKKLISILNLAFFLYLSHTYSQEYYYNSVNRQLINIQKSLESIKQLSELNYTSISKLKTDINDLKLEKNYNNDLYSHNNQTIPSTIYNDRLDMVPANTEHIVKPGDTIISLANLYRVSPQEIIDLNTNLDPRRMAVNSIILIPVYKKQDNNSIGVYDDHSSNYTKIHDDFNLENSEHINYKVQHGDYLRLIADKFNTTVEDIRFLNNISNKDMIYVGQFLLIPKNDIYLSGHSKYKKQDNHILYRIKQGDTLYKIANYFKLDINELAIFNNIPKNKILYTGEILKIPVK